MVKKERQATPFVINVAVRLFFRLAALSEAKPSTIERLAKLSKKYEISQTIPKFGGEPQNQYFKFGGEPQSRHFKFGGELQNQYFKFGGELQNN